MTLGLVGRKVGMTRIFTDDGDSLPVTVLDVSDNRVTQIKTSVTDGYSAVQVTFGKRRASRVTKAVAGHLAKAGVEAGHVFKEFRVPEAALAGHLSKAGVEAGHVFKEFRVPEAAIGDLKVGANIGVDIFKVGQRVDVTGSSKGKGFAGVIKRHNFSSNRASHGNSVSHRKPGSIGQNQDPGRVFPGKRMAGHLGDAKSTVQSLEIVRIDPERQLLMVKGAVPGSKERDVVVHPTAKPKKAPAAAAAAPAKKK